MPPYDCMLLFKPSSKKQSIVDLVARVGKHVCRRNGVVTEVKCFGTVQLGYGVRKLDGRFFQGRLVQMSMMATPEINKELHYLNKEDLLLRWLLVKQRDTKIGLDYIGDDGGMEMSKLTRRPKADDNDDDDGEDDDREEYEVREEGEEEDDKTN